MVGLKLKISAPEHCSQCKSIVLIFTVVLEAQLIMTAELSRHTQTNTMLYYAGHCSLLKYKSALCDIVF